MKTKMHLLGLMIAVFGLVSLVAGAAFIGIAVQKNNFVVSQMRAQNVTLGLTKDEVAAGKLVDNAQAAQVAADTLAGHLKNNYGTYSQLLSTNPGGKYDPTKPSNLSYTQGLNMINSFDIAILGFGVVQLATATGAILIVIGLAILISGIVLFRLSRRLT